MENDTIYESAKRIAMMMWIEDDYEPRTIRYIDSGEKLSMQDFRSGNKEIRTHSNHSFFVDNLEVRIKQKIGYFNEVSVFKKGTNQEVTEFLKVEWSNKLYGKFPILRKKKYYAALTIKSLQSFHDNNYALNGKDLEILTEKFLASDASETHKKRFLKMFETYQDQNPEEFI